MAAHSYIEKPIQIIDGQYLDQQRLSNLLRNMYGISDEGKDNFRVQVRKQTLCNQYLIRTPRNHNKLRLNRYKLYPSEQIRGASELTLAR